MTQKSIDKEKAKEFLFRSVGELGSFFTIGLAYIGDRLGLWKALAGGDFTSQELAQQAKLSERYVEEWLKGMVAADYVEYDPANGKYFLTDEKAFVLVNEDSPMFLAGAVELSGALLLNLPKILEVFRNGRGLTVNQLGMEVTEGVERFFMPGYKNLLVQDWLTRVPGLQQKLEKGGQILDVGCGCGQSTVTLGKAYPNATVVGVDPDSTSMNRCRNLVSQIGLKNVQLLQIPVQDLPKERNYDLACLFDCVHDMSDPVSALKTVRELLKEDGVAIWNEPKVSDNPLENRTLVGKLVAGFSPFYCLPVSLTDGGMGTGNQLGERGARKLAHEAEFSGFEKLPIEHATKQFFLLKR